MSARGRPTGSGRPGSGETKGAAGVRLRTRPQCAVRGGIAQATAAGCGQARAGGGGARPVRGGRDARGGRAQTVERIAADAEMIIALPGPAPGGETQVRRSQPRFIRVIGEITTSVRGRAHRHERRPVQRRDLGISQYETVT